jgi:hypothetical protein
LTDTTINDVSTFHVGERPSHALPAPHLTENPNSRPAGTKGNAGDSGNETRGGSNLASDPIGTTIPENTIAIGAETDPYHTAGGAAGRASQAFDGHASVCWVVQFTHYQNWPGSR